ncbi:MAG: hypothetical protein GC161_14160 [Planctomycetaceae bacterium]|nr:hypothetical protein [Planctomycetaceae bacterium]
MRSRRWLALLPVVLGLGSCVQLDWTRESYEEPMPKDAVQRIPIGADASVVFDVLGAPSGVWELAEGAVVLAYANRGGVEFGISGSLSLDDSPVAPSMAWGDEKIRIPGLVVELDSGFRVRDVRRGTARDASPPRRRPVPVE